MSSLLDSHQNGVCKKTEENHEDYEEKSCQEWEDIIPTLPKAKGGFGEPLVQYQGTWLSPDPSLKGVMMVQQHFKAQPTDIVLATFPKSGTTWFKALIFAITTRAYFEYSNHPLLTCFPHDCIPFIEILFAQNQKIPSNLNHSSSTRLFSTHIPYHLLPDSAKSSGCRIVYAYRDPKDVLVSTWHFFQKLSRSVLSLEQAFEMFCEGVSIFGPFWDHVSGYWNESLKSPDKVLFLCYEDMKRESLVNVKRLADFLGCPFTAEEERQGVVHEIIKLCSFENLSNLEVNKKGGQQFKQIAVENSTFFRKGEVGDWEKYLTADMVKRIDQITEQNFHGSRLTTINHNLVED